MHCYTAYGFSVHSEIPLPGLVPGGAPADIRIRLATPFDPPVEGDDAQTLLRLAGNEAFLSVSGVGAFRIRNGREVVVRPAVGVPPGRLRLFLVGTVMALLLYQRGLLVLHASAVSIGGGVVAFVGETGLGKSSLAAALHGFGCPLVADDLTPVEIGPAGPLVHPGFPQVKLTPEAARALGRDPAGLIPFHAGEEKGACRLPDGFPRGPLPLRRIYLLERQPGVAIEPVRPAEALVELLGNSYPSKLMQSGGAPHFRQCGAVARLTPAFRLRGFTDLEAIVSRAESVLAHIEDGRRQEAEVIGAVTKF